jgi:hypothetical protein
MTVAEASSAVGILCYGLAAAFRIRFSETATAPTGASLAPPVLLISGGLAETHYLLVLAGCQCAATISAVAARRFGRVFVTQTAAFGICVIALKVLEGAVGDRLVLAILGATLYLAVDYALLRIWARTSLLPAEDRRTWLLLQAVLVCACGLTMLGVTQLTWPAFLAMALVLVLTKREFEAFAKSRMAYTQTVRAIDRLKELETPFSGSG